MADHKDTINDTSKLCDRRPIVPSGPSGVDKGTLTAALVDKSPEIFAVTVSHTTRQPRPGEQKGRAYCFVSLSHFESMIDDSEFVEHTFYSGNYYGTSKKAIRDQEIKDKIAMLDIEMHGLQQIKASNSVEVRSVFIMPPNMAELERRLRDRRTDSEDSVQRRLSQAREEIEHAESIPCPYDIVIINESLKEAFEELEGFLLKG